MALRRSCRDVLMEVIKRPGGFAEDLEVGVGMLAPPSRLQLVVDAFVLGIVNSICLMADLHSEGVTSIELLTRPREPLPDLDGMYMLVPDRENMDLLLQDFAKHPQHRKVHIVCVGRLEASLISLLAESVALASRVKTLVEIPFTFYHLQDRGFHFGMEEALQTMFPTPAPSLVDEIASKLADVCACLNAYDPSICHANSVFCTNVAKQLQMVLSAQKGSADSKAVHTTVFIVDRSVDMAATLVHEYTYEAALYDLLDGVVFDANTGVVNRGEKKDLLGESDSAWAQIRDLHISSVAEWLDHAVKDISQKTKTRDASSVNTSELLKMVQQIPQHKDMAEKLALHQFLLEKVFQRVEADKIMGGLGGLEQDIACGVDKDGKDIKATQCQDALIKFVSNNPDLPSESRLRLVMLYFACMANISEKNLTEVLRLSSEDTRILTSLLQTQLMEVPDSQRHKLDKGCVHRGTKEQNARFKQNSRTKEFELSRFEPRIKELVVQLCSGKLSHDEFPLLKGSAAGAPFSVAQSACPAMPDDWSFTPFIQADTVAVSQRVIVFVLGGITHSEIRVVEELRAEYPQIELSLGGTAVITPRRIMDMFSPLTQADLAHSSGSRVRRRSQPTL